MSISSLGEGTARFRMPLLLLTAMAAAASAIGHAMTLEIAAPAVVPTEQSQVGTSIERGISDRDRDLARRKRAADMREQALRATERRLAEAPAAARPAAPVADVTTASPGREPLDDLARIYQAMKPARAAVIFAALDPSIQVQVARRMRERPVAQMMANMEPAAAARLSMALAGRPVTSAPPVPARRP